MRITRSLSAIIATILIAAIPLAASAQFSVGVGFTVGSPPPPLPVYSMPVAPYPNWQWTPGYWAWGSAGYYWVPGVWVAPPSVGVYWTPGYWGYASGGYGWNAGYWGPSVGFYGGINYGFGYFGAGFVGGYWSGGAFRYNTAVVNVNRTYIHNVYVNKTVIHGNVYNHVSYNGGHGGISARPTPAQLDARRHGIAPTSAQVTHARVAAQDRNLYANVNHGKPPVTAASKPFNDSNKPAGSAPVTAADKHTAQSDVKANGGKSYAPATHSSNTQPHHNHPTSSTGHGSGHPYSSHPAGHPQGSMQGHPQGGQGKPPSGGQGKPPSGGDHGKPPKH